jgi:hypothetical protein
MDKITATIRRKIVKENLFKEKKYSAHDDLWLSQIFLIILLFQVFNGRLCERKFQKKEYVFKIFCF